MSNVLSLIYLYLINVLQYQLLDLAFNAGITRDGAEVQDLIAVIRLLSADDRQVPEAKWRELMEDVAADVPPPLTPSIIAATSAEGGVDASQRWVASQHLILSVFKPSAV